MIASLLRRGGLRRRFFAGDGGLVPQAHLSGPVPWVIAIMVALTAIALAAGLALGHAVSAATAEIEGGLTVQLVEPRANIRAGEVERAIVALNAAPGIAEARLVPQEELDALLEPWLGTGLEGATGSAIPVPALIDVRLKGPATPAGIRDLEKALAPVAPSARIDAQANWLRPVFGAMVSLQWLALALIVLLAIALAAAVLLAARSALGANRDTIEIVHLLGGSDAQIARVFQRSIGLDAAIGGIVGLALAIVAVLAIGRKFGSLGAGLVDKGMLGWADWLLLALVPVVAALLAMVTARLTVMQALRKML